MARVTQNPYGTTTNVGANQPKWQSGYYDTRLSGTNNSGATAFSRASTPNATLAKNNGASGVINKGVNNIANYARNATAGYTPAGGSGTGGGGNSYYNSGYSDSNGGGYYAEAAAPAFDPMAALMAALEAQRAAREQAVNAANAALEKQRGVAQGRYKSAREQALADYQDLRNRASVQNFKAGKNLREVQADRGAFNSGLGLQERLKLESNNTNNQSRINTAERSALNDLWNNLANVEAQIDMQKANNLNSTLNNYQDTVSSLITALFSNYAPSAAYNSMLASLGGAGSTGLNNIVQNTAAGLGTNTGIYDTLLRYGTY